MEKEVKRDKSMDDVLEFMMACNRIEQYHSLKDVNVSFDNIGGLFTWDGSPQGSTFWADIANVHRNLSEYPEGTLKD